MVQSSSLSVLVAVEERCQARAQRDPRAPQPALDRALGQAVLGGERGDVLAVEVVRLEQARLPGAQQCPKATGDQRRSADGKVREGEPARLLAGEAGRRSEYQSV